MNHSDKPSLTVVPAPPDGGEQVSTAEPPDNVVKFLARNAAKDPN